MIRVHARDALLYTCTAAPSDGVIVGKSQNPVTETGDRVVHLGIVEPAFPKRADDGHV